MAVTIIVMTAMMWLWFIHSKARDIISIVIAIRPGKTSNIQKYTASATPNTPAIIELENELYFY